MINLFLYFVFIVLADIVAANFVIPIFPWWGIYAPAGVIFIGALFSLRDAIHERFGLRTVYFVVFAASVFALGTGFVTGGLALQRVAVASAVAFLFSELVDTYLYSVFPRRVRVLGSNFFSSAIDSVIFITLAFGFSWQFVVGQWIAKNVFGAVWYFLFMRRD